MADPLSLTELAELRADLAETLDGAVDQSFVAAFEKVARLLATLDAEQARHEAKVDAVILLRSTGAVTLDRPRWREFLATHTVDGDLDPIGHAAYALFAGLTGDEVERHYERHPEARERHQAHARELLAQLQDERR